jgi:succinate dehydrogenase/fumarate reductase flavoprotein subunit
MTGVSAGPAASPAGRGAGESVVTNTTATAVFTVATAGVTIDGFTINNNVGEAINISGTQLGTTIINNVIAGTPVASPTTQSGIRSSVMAGLQLTDNFAENLVAEVARYNEFAVAGVDEDFRRGEFMYDQEWPSAPYAETRDIEEWPSADQPSSAMYPLSETGPYYAFIVAASAVDTNGGPIINTDGQVTTWADQPVVGLYGAGNAVASAGVNAYWGGGMTLGNAHVWGYRAAKHATESDEIPV